MKISELPIATKKWLEESGFDLSKELTESQDFSFDGNTSVKFGFSASDDFSDGTPLECALDSGKTNHAITLIENGALNNSDIQKHPNWLFRSIYRSKINKIPLLQAIFNNSQLHLTDELMEEAREKLGGSLLEWVTHTVFGASYSPIQIENAKTLELLEKQFLQQKSSAPANRI